MGTEHAAASPPGFKDTVPCHKQGSYHESIWGHTTWKDAFQQPGKDLFRLHPCGSTGTDTEWTAHTSRANANFAGMDRTSLLDALAQVSNRESKIWQGRAPLFPLCVCVSWLTGVLHPPWVILPTTLSLQVFEIQVLSTRTGKATSNKITET